MGTSTRAGAKKAAGGQKLSKEQLAAEVARVVGAGKADSVHTVDFSDPHRPRVCLEVDFPVLPINRIAALEASSGALKKPVYLMSKWWARRQSSVFRSLLLSAAMKAPDDPAEAARAVWDAYYHNHQRKGAFKHLRVADIFMGGGTTLVEGGRLGMQMLGTDLNPVAWFVVKNSIARVQRAEVEALLAAVEAAVKPAIMPFYTCECPRGHKGAWTRISTGEAMPSAFDPLALSADQRADFSYEGPEAIYVFWAKHGPCQVTGCGHRTPLVSSPVVAVKSLTIRSWPAYKCSSCRERFDVDEADARLAPGVPQVVSDSEVPFAVLDPKGGVRCPSCGHQERFPRLPGKASKKKVELTLLVHPEWLRGEASMAPDGLPYGGSSTDTPGATARWNAARARTARLVEVRGEVPEEVTCPVTGVTFRTDEGTLPRKSKFACGACGVEQDVLTSIKASRTSGPVAAYAVQAYCARCDESGVPNGGRYFVPAVDATTTTAAIAEWEHRKDADLAGFWPRSEIPYGFMTGIANGDIREGHGFRHWWKMFGARQLLVHSQLLRAILHVRPNEFSWESREFVLGAFQQYLRFNNGFSIWHLQNNQVSAFFSNNNYHSKSSTLECSVFTEVGDGSWRSARSALLQALDWQDQPWELVSAAQVDSLIGEQRGAGKSVKVACGDPVADTVTIDCASATALESVQDQSQDLVITDPPFGGLLHYSELSDFFYVWLRLALKDRYPAYFGAEYTPKSLEAVANRARRPDDADAFYQRLLTECWREAHRILKPGGLLAFTFHHSEDEPWVAVLESLFDAGFYLEATYPIRSDETKGDGQFGSKQIEYDIIHVCRKRTEEPTPVSWARMRRRVLDDVRQLKTVLENHASAGLPPADLKVIKRGKALEYYSRHYGKVYVDEGRPFSVRDALIGINQLLDEEAGTVKEPPPGNAEPFTRQYLSLFRGVMEQPRDQVQKDLRGTGYSPSELVERGWCTEERKTFYVKEPRSLAAEWYRRHRRNLTSDYDQAAFLIGAATDGSGINLRETLANENFRPHPALKALLDWHTRHGATKDIRAAAQRALAIYATWEQEHPATAAQLTFFAE
jgi:putative DNA methylase